MAAMNTDWLFNNSQNWCDDNNQLLYRITKAVNNALSDRATDSSPQAFLAAVKGAGIIITDEETFLAIYYYGNFARKVPTVLNI